LKKNLYQERFHTHEYVWFSPDTLELSGFRLINQTYEPIEPNQLGWLWSEELELYFGIHDKQLRYFLPDGQLVPTPDEAALQAQQQAERLINQLRSLGIEPET
jgi:predicted transposase YdaD